MNNITVRPDELKAVLYEMLKEFDSNVAQAAGEAAAEVAKDAKQQLKSSSPKRSGKYASGWAIHTEKSEGIVREVSVHNKAKPGLTHLLEFGHVTKKGTTTVFDEPYLLCDFRVKRKTSKKKFAKKCKEIHQLISSIRHWSLKLLTDKLNDMLKEFPLARPRIYVSIYEGECA